MPATFHVPNIFDAYTKILHEPMNENFQFLCDIYSGSIGTFNDNGFEIFNNIDNSKIFKFDASNISTATTRIYSMPNISGYLATLSNLSQTFTGPLVFSNTVDMSNVDLQLGSSTANGSIVNVNSAATVNGATKTTNIGVGGVVGSTSNVNIGSSTAGTVTINSPTLSLPNLATLNLTNTNLSVEYIGIGGATADDNNRLSINTSQALFNNKGNSIDLYINKYSISDEAAIIYQDNFSTRAIVGLLGDDNYVVKQSSDGITYTTLSFPNITATLAHTGNASQTFQGKITSNYPATITDTTYSVSAGVGFYPSTTGGMGLTTGGISEHLFNGAAYDINFSGTPVMRMNGISTSAGNSGTFQCTRQHGLGSAVVSGDRLGAFQFRGYYDASNNLAGATILVSALENFTSGAAGSRVSFNVAGIGSASTTEVIRLEALTGLSMFGANVVIDQNRNHLLRSYTIGTEPTATAGLVNYTSDLGGGGNVTVGNGTNFKRASNKGQTTVNTNANFTLTVLSSAGNILHTGTLTADRTITLSTTNASVGDEFTITRTGSGAFNLIVGGLKNLATNTWCKVVYDGTAWYLAMYGAL